MTLDLSVEEIIVIRQALRTCIDLGDRFFTFAPDTQYGGHKIYYGSGNSEIEDTMSTIADELIEKIGATLAPSSIQDKMDIMREMKRSIPRKIKRIDPEQTTFL